MWGLSSPIEAFSSPSQSESSLPPQIHRHNRLIHQRELISGCPHQASVSYGRGSSPSPEPRLSPLPSVRVRQLPLQAHEGFHSHEDSHFLLPVHTGLMVPAPEPRPITLYQRMLQSNFQDTFLCVQEGWAEEKQRLLDIYTELYVTAGRHVCINAQHEVRHIEDSLKTDRQTERQVRPGQMFLHPSGEYRPIRTVLTNGIAGIGKSFLVQKFVLDWAEQRSNQDVHLLFPISFRQLNPLRGQTFSLAELVHELDHGGELRLKPGLRKYFCALTLDSNTAHKQLNLTDDLKTVTAVRERRPYAEHPERSAEDPQVREDVPERTNCTHKHSWTLNLDLEGFGCSSQQLQRFVSPQGGGGDLDPSEEHPSEEASNVDSNNQENLHRVYRPVIGRRDEQLLAEQPQSLRSRGCWTAPGPARPCMAMVHGESADKRRACGGVHNKERFC
ncbi:hypothetical protein FQA47_013216 [Oryzias melastigma]|uniref:FISNA domain-containing protein n=1 Tax=Oryzias melastigma TaxID=30732 RepID=A0A834FHK3_ORYME|nr:hypothetical protein FQA47_013216 [Oryzias melastigma]